MSEKNRHKHAEACNNENLNEIDTDFDNDNGTSSAGKAENSNESSSPASGDADGSTVTGKAKNNMSQKDGTENGTGSEGESGQNGPACDDPKFKALQDELEAVKKELAEKSDKCGEYLDKLQRTAAEFDNFKKRSIKEKEALYTDAVCDVVSAFLPVIDNVERALKAISGDSSAQSLKEGVEMVFRQFGDVLKSIGVEEIKALNETFDPMLHNAVMHVEDETLGPGVITEEFQKGYIYKEKVIRYSMVKVAN